MSRRARRGDEGATSQPNMFYYMHTFNYHNTIFWCLGYHLRLHVILNIKQNGGVGRTAEASASVGESSSALSSSACGTAGRGSPRMSKQKATLRCRGGALQRGNRVAKCENAAEAGSDAGSEAGPEAEILPGEIRLMPKSGRACVRFG